MSEHLEEEYSSSKFGTEFFLPTIVEMIKNSRYSQDVFVAEILQPANEINRSLVLSIIEKLVYKNSKIIHPEHLLKVQKLIKEGKSCIIMPEHYSNFDIPAFFYLVKNFYQELVSITERIVSLAASKLNAESGIVLAFSEAFNRIMIYPAREKNAKKNLTSEEEEQAKQLEIINQRAIKTMLATRDKGHPILVFPSGTRYRPENPESRNVLEQTASFLKRFDYVCFIGITGNTLLVSPNNNMAEDIARKDSMVYWIDEPIQSKDFMNQVDGGSTNKKGVAKYVTEYLLHLHNKAEEVRAELIKDTPPEDLGPITSSLELKEFIQAHDIDPNIMKKLIGKTI